MHLARTAPATTHASRTHSSRRGTALAVDFVELVAQQQRDGDVNDRHQLTQLDTRVAPRVARIIGDSVDDEGGHGGDQGNHVGGKTVPHFPFVLLDVPEHGGVAKQTG